MNKSFITNIIALFVFLTGFFLNDHILKMIGLFALSGAITNQIAVHMLFEKVPLFYGSGVIENRFEEFKSSIYDLIMQQFFTKENLDKFLENEFEGSDRHFNFSELIEQTDITPAYDSLKNAVLESSFGGMLSMFGGEKALEPLREPFILKMKLAMDEIVHTDEFQSSLKSVLGSSHISEDIIERVSIIISGRLDELSPKMIKHIVQNIIKEHLGWLVVWGGVFGGLIGFVSSLVL